MDILKSDEPTIRSFLDLADKNKLDEVETKILNWKLADLKIEARA